MAVSAAGPGSPPLCNGSGDGGDPFDPEDWNLTAEELRLKYLGPPQSALFAPICTAYALIFTVGAAGNALTCLVITRHRALRTATNLYLLSLAAADLLLLLLGMPLELYELRHNYPFPLGAGGCLFRTLLFEAVCLASVLTVTALGVERYVAVAHPLRARALLTRARARRVIGGVWAAALLCALPNTSLHGIRELEVPGRGVVPHSALCTLVRPRPLYRLVVHATALLFFGLPMAVLGTLYLLIGLRLRRERRERRLWAPGRPLPAQRHPRGRVTKMLFVLVVVFGVCWAPFHVDRLMWSCVSHWTEELLQAFEYVHVASGIFFYLSSAANPVLYSRGGGGPRPGCLCSLICPKPAPEEGARQGPRALPARDGRRGRWSSGPTSHRGGGRKRRKRASGTTVCQVLCKVFGTTAGADAFLTPILQMKKLRQAVR